MIFEFGPAIQKIQSGCTKLYKISIPTATSLKKKNIFTRSYIENIPSFQVWLCSFLSYFLHPLEQTWPSPSSSLHHLGHISLWIHLVTDLIYEIIEINFNTWSLLFTNDAVKWFLNRKVNTVKNKFMSINWSNI